MNNLLFFTKEGYPHNFQYNKENEKWEGKIFFDENSDQTFKTQSLHIFEEVEPISFNLNADLLSLNYNNNSGLTFTGESDFQKENITNILKSNNSSEFFSKWIYGNDFHKKFPVGTIVTFSGVTGSTTIIPYTISSTELEITSNINTSITVDINLNFVENQIITLYYDELNSLLCKILNYDKLTGILTINIISSKGSGTYNYWNILLEPVYDFIENQYFTVIGVKKNAFLIVTNTPNDIFDFTFIVGCGRVHSLNMISINDYNRNLSNDIFFQNLYKEKKLSIINSNFNDGIVTVKNSGISYSYLNEIKLNGTKDQILNIKLDLFSDRPKVSQGNIIFSGFTSSPNIGYITFDKYNNMLEPELIYTLSGETYLKKEIIFEDYTGGTLFNDSTFIVDSVVNTINLGTKQIDFKKYQLKSDNSSKNIQWNTLQLSDEINIKIGDLIKLSGATGNELMNNREFNITNILQSSGITILLTPDYIINETGCIYTVIQKLKRHQIKTITVTSSTDVTSFNNLTINDTVCYLTTNQVNFYQTYLSDNTNSTPYETIESFIKKYKSNFYQYGIDIYHTIRNNEDYLSIESLYGTKHRYFNVSGYTNGIQIPNNFTLSNYGITEKYDIITYEKLTNEKTNRSDNNLYKNETQTEIIFDLKNENNRFGFKLSLNNNEYFINYSANTQTTINSFINKYYDIFYSNGFLINSGYNYSYGNYSLNFTSDIDIWDLDVTVNLLSSYNIVNRNRNRSIILSGNELRSSTLNFYDIGLSVGMLIKISGSTYNTNNKEYNIIGLTPSGISLSYQGYFISEYDIPIHCITREYLRKPRSEYYRDIYFRVYWEIPYENETDKSIFLYDVSGDQLKLKSNYPNESLKYVGRTPLIDPLSEPALNMEGDCIKTLRRSQNDIVLLNKEPNKDIKKISIPKFQKTIFEELYFKLEQLDSSQSYNWIPIPLEIYLGYNSEMEGVNNRVLKIEKIEKFENSDKLFSYSGFTNSGSSIAIPNFIFSGNTCEYLGPIDFNFISYGFKKGQIINFEFKDQSKYEQNIFENIYNYKILDVNRNKITIDTTYHYENISYETGYTYATGFTYFITTGKTYHFKIEVQPKEILSCSIYGETEIEDIRHKVNLNNLGIKSEEDIYEILYQSDIQDNAIDYTLFNKKRKEMLSDFTEIYNYIGSYKSLINAINYFGYNDLQLYEYYQNIDQSSVLYGKLHKILIPDIFNNNVKGWNEIDFISGKYQNYNAIDNIVWKKSNLFNLAYRITDDDGNNVLIYSLEDVQYKLTKLKTWLRNNIIPISANLLDITGVADTNQTLYQDYDESNQTIKSVINRSSTIVNFNYTATLNFGSDYLISVNFYILSGDTKTGITISSGSIYNPTTTTTLCPDDENYYIINTGITNNIEYILPISEECRTDLISKENTPEIPLSYSVKIRTYYLSGNTSHNSTDILIPVQYFKILKTDLTPFSFNINKYVDPYIYIETTTYDNDGNGIGYVNNKMFYFDEPRNHWLVNHNFDLTKMKYWQSPEYLNNNYNRWTFEDIVNT